MLTTVLLIVGLSWEDAMRRLPPPARATAPAVNVAQPQPPAPPPPPPPSPASPPAATAEPSPPSVTRSILAALPGARSRDRAQTEQPPAPAALKPAAPPTVWQLADDSGQAWTHTDPVWLKQWVALRNEALASARASQRRSVPLAPAFPYFPSGSCPGGVCRVR
jgi:hypothetical protein